MTRRLSITIAITTKNRHKILGTVVAQLAKCLPAAAELLVVDDGSDPIVSETEWGLLPFPVRLIRHRESKGLIVSRNELARECRTPFLLSCDDDSYPISGDLEAAVGYLERHPELIALSFPYLEGPARKPMSPSVSAEPYRVRQFIGCAHLMRVGYFVRLGGYWEWLVQQNEERELCYRALQCGWSVAHFPGVTFYHDYTPSGRDWDRHEFYTMRNEMAVELQSIPFAAAAVKVVRNGILSIMQFLRCRRSGSFRGYLAGLVHRHPATRRLTWSQYRDLQELRWS